MDFLQADVMKLIGDPAFCKGRYHYAQYCTPEAIARNKGERFRKELDACEAAANPPDW